MRHFQKRVCCKAIQRAAQTLGYGAVRDVRQGKLFEITLDADDEDRARALVEELASKLLANPVIESFRVLNIEK